MDRRSVTCAAWLFALVMPAVICVAQEAPRSDEGVLGAAEPLLVTDYDVDLLHEGPAYQAAAEIVLRNPRSATIEGVGLVPLPERAIPRGFVAENGDVRMKGVVRSRERAVDVYRDITRATARGRDPALLERLGDRWLRATVSPIAPNGQVRLTVGYLGFSEKLGAWREVELPSDRTAYRGIWVGSSRKLLPAATSTGLPASGATDTADKTLTTWCFRAPGADGTFCLEIDPSKLLAQPLTRTTYLLVLETPESTSEALAKSGGAALAEVVRGLRDDDSIELFANGADGGSFGGPVAAVAENRERAIAELGAAAPHGYGRLEQRLRAALALAADRSGPVRIVVASAQRRVGRLEELAEAVERATMRQGTGFALFTCALGTVADASGLAELARKGRGRAFAILAAPETEIVAPPLAAAARRPVLIAPQVTVAGATELVIERKRHVTYGETMRVSGRYPEGMTGLVRIEGHVLERFVEPTFTTTFDDENVAHPWVATIWAGLRARELAAEEQSDDLDAYLARLAERFSLIGKQTVALGLEPAFENRLPPLIGSADGSPVAQLDTPEQPTTPGPAGPERPGDGGRDGPERRPPPPRPLGPSNPGPSAPPFAPPAGPSIPPTRAPGRGAGN